MATSTQVNEILNRLTALDGITSPIPSGAQVPVIQKDLNGLHTTINQLTLTIQAQLNAVSQQLQTLQGTVNKILGGVPGIVPISAPAIPGDAITAYDATTGLFTQAPVDTGAYVPLTSVTGNGFADNSTTGINITESDPSVGGITISANAMGGNGVAVRALSGTVYLDASAVNIATVHPGEIISVGSGTAGAISVTGAAGISITDQSSGGIALRETSSGAGASGIGLETSTGVFVLQGDNTTDPQMLLQSENGGLSIDHSGNVSIYASMGKMNITAASGIGFFGATPITKPTITGSKTDGTALASLIAALVAYGLIVDGTTA
jgi:hypothetical protein